jgi:CheY-like chemotaxis protein
VQLNALVVEDDASSLELICEALHGSGITAVGTRSPLHATDLVDRRRFDGIFLDLAMPGLNGSALARRIRRSTHNATTPIVVVGEPERPGPHTIKDAFAAGAQFYLAKPLDRSKLERLVHSTQGSLVRERLRRHSVELRTEVSCRTGAGECSGVSVEISEKGLVFQFDGALHSSDYVRLSFRLPRSERPIEATGTIQRVMRESGRQRAICRFDSMNAASSRALHEFLVSSAEIEESRPQAGRGPTVAANWLGLH